MSELDDEYTPVKLDKLPDVMTQSYKQLNAAAMSWLGALQYVAYAKPAKPVKTDGSIIAGGPSQWFVGVKNNVEGSLKRIEAHLAESWNLRRDKRHDTEEAWQRYAQRMEREVAQFTRHVLAAEKQIDEGAMRPTHAIRRSQEKLNRVLGETIRAFAESGYELGEPEYALGEREESLLAMQAKIVDGRGMAR